jgi:hypothetical protein
MANREFAPAIVEMQPAFTALRRPAAQRLVNGTRQRDHDTETPALAIAQRNFTAVVHGDSTNRSQA